MSRTILYLLLPTNTQNHNAYHSNIDLHYIHSSDQSLYDVINILIQVALSCTGSLSAASVHAQRRPAVGQLLCHNSCSALYAVTITSLAIAVYLFVNKTSNSTDSKSVVLCFFLNPTGDLKGHCIWRLPVSLLVNHFKELTVRGCLRH